MEYPSNSFKAKAQAQNAPQQEPAKQKSAPVVSNAVKVRKKSEIRKFSEALIKQDAQGIKHYIVSEWLIPTIQKGILGLLQTMFYGANAPMNTATPNMASRVSYCNYSKPVSQQTLVQPSTNYSWPDILYATRGDAESVLARMHERVRAYQHVKVGDMYDLSGVSAPYTSYNYGWLNIDSAYVAQNMDGTFRIILPRAVPIE